MTGGGESRALTWAGRLAVLVAGATAALSGWFAAAACADLLDGVLGTVAATAIGVVAFLPAAFVGFALALVLMSLLLALFVRRLPDGGEA